MMRQSPPPPSAREETDHVVRPSPTPLCALLPWTLAASLALATAWFGQLYLANRSESDLLRDRAALAELALRSSQHQLEAERIITRQQLAVLERQAPVDLARLKCSVLTSRLDHSPKALAVAVWDSTKQEGVLQVEALPALLPHQDYQLWIMDPQYPDPIDSGVFAVQPETGEARIAFKPRQPVGVVSAFAVTLERKGGASRAEGPLALRTR
jgi:hypothetical protein